MTRLRPHTVSRDRLRQAWGCFLLALSCLAALPAHALSGTDIAHIVNGRYNDTRTHCAIDKPAYFCAGLIVRPLNGNSATNFWAPTSGEAAAQSMSFVYLRRDVDVARLPYSAGFILSDALTAIGHGKPMHVRCAYPLDEAVSAGSGDHGCNLGGGDIGAPDLNSCDANGVTDAAGWMSHHAANGWQCSFSVNVATKFYTALLAHKAYADTTRTPSLLVAPWTIDAPRAIPIQAIYFDVSNGGQLAQAQQYQMAYHKATGEWLTILRMGFDPGGKATFGFAEDDQLDYGFAVADDLNRRFNDTRRECPGGKASVYCSGVVIRGVAPGNASWNPSQDAINKNGVSTSFLRTDAQFYIPFRPQGLVFRPLDAPSAYHVTPRCMYPPDGNLHLRTDGCGPSSAGPATGPCAAIGVDTLAKWLSHFAQYSSRGCSFAITVDAFELSLEARRTFGWPPTGAYATRNELVIAAWPPNIPGSLPLEAFFYSDTPTLAGTQTIQRAYYATTGRFLPIVKMENPLPIAGIVFTYRADDQSTAQGGAGLIAPSVPSERESNDTAPMGQDDGDAFSRP
ncbi:hypothetical protein UC34_10605 [Pandoraea vervacti]|uniref:Uncharacterized protein n=1 Tax=Pandoraea vervacti TaxID=656178 RepID=A0ABN4FQE7_9BURK|nr:hypothetical protein [Pandoraea vervacti]AJP57337.1 hypothetical protein UC34_10605 [Pandoraea vervacti]